jgi:hypothetical protein
VLGGALLGVSPLVPALFVDLSIGKTNQTVLSLSPTV